MAKTFYLNRKEYISLGKAFLCKVEVPDAHAEILMETLLDADEKGIHTHGFFRLPTYIEQIKRGNINPNPKISIEERGITIRLMHGGGGLGSVISSLAMQEAIKLSRDYGVGIVSVNGSNHFGTAAYYSEMAAKENQIGIAMTNASPAIAPTGGKKAVLGNNPWSISVNTNLGHPITLDMANSVARGKIRLKAIAGEPIPIGWALDKDGNPTTDAQEALEGLILPIGDHKGYGITFMIDVLTGVLSGAKFGNQNPLIDEDGKRDNGHLFISFNIGNFMPLEAFRERIDELIEMVKSAPRIDQSREIFLPGEIEWRNKLNQKNGTVAMTENVVKKIEDLCHAYDIPLPAFQERDTRVV